MKQYTVGIDVGGTNIKIGLVNPSGKIVSRTVLETKQFNKTRTKLIDAIVDKVVDFIHYNKLTKKDICGVGIGLPGLINPQKGIVNFLPNIPGWKDVPLKRLIQDKLHIPTFIDNDVNLVTLGEWKFGAGKGFKNLVCITLGTGVGSGLILDNKLYRGEGFVAGELGHVPLNEEGEKCNCGGFACFERSVGNKYFIEKARKVFKSKEIRFQDIFKLANQGDKRALKLWEENATHIGNGLVGIINILNPRLVIIGGGVSNNYKFFQDTVKKVIKQRAMKVQANMVKVVRAKLGNGAGIIGAHALVKDSIGGFKK